VKAPDLTLRVPMPEAVDYSVVVMTLAEAAKGHGIGWTEISFDPETDMLVLRGWRERPADYGSVP
jgi:hypothetical protein